jgi:hypothetical protein
VEGGITMMKRIVTAFVRILSQKLQMTMMMMMMMMKMNQGKRILSI